MSMDKPFFDPRAAGRPLRVAAFMSGSGTNITTLLQMEDPGFEVSFIFSDRTDGKCRGEQIAHEYGLPYFAYDTRRFHAVRGIKRSVLSAEGMAARKEYDQVAATLLKAFDIDVIALGGYMSFLTLGRGVNVHPADLSIINEDGSRTFVGDDAVLDAIAAGQSELRSSTLWIDQGVDSGPLLMVSDALPVVLDHPLEQIKADSALMRRVADEHQERLKEAGDWIVFPETLRLIAAGRMGLTADGVVTLDGKAYPMGVRPSDLG